MTFYTVYKCEPVIHHFAMSLFSVQEAYSSGSLVFNHVLPTAPEMSVTSIQCYHH